MDNYAELIRQMAETFVTAVRALETENAKLKSENEFLWQEVRNLRGRTDEWWDGGKKLC